MKKILILMLAAMLSMVAWRPMSHVPVMEKAKANVAVEKSVAIAEVSPFEKAVEIIKKYEGLHSARHWPLVGYGHKVLPGEKISRGKVLSEKEADLLLRKDLLKNCAVFREFGPDSLLLGVLAYNIGSGATLRSSVVTKLRAGNRDIRETYLAHCRYRGKVHTQIKNRRIEEFEALFIEDINGKLPQAEMALSAPQTNSKIELAHNAIIAQ